MKTVLLALTATFLLAGCSKHDAAADSTPNPGVGAANPGVPATAAVVPRAALPPAAHTTDTTTPEEATALAGPNNRNMDEAEAYLAAHPAARLSRHKICDYTSDHSDPVGIYCNELEHADIDAYKPGGVTNTNSL